MRDYGTAWIDPIRCKSEDHSNLPEYALLSTTIDYSTFQIGDESFWLPACVKAETDETKSKRKVTYDARYSDCRKFGASVTIRP